MSKRDLVDPQTQIKQNISLRGEKSLRFLWGPSISTFNNFIINNLISK